MKRFTLLRSTSLALCFVATSSLLASCAGTQSGEHFILPQAPSMPLIAAAHRGGSWMSPRAKREDLVYVSNSANNTVSAYGLSDHRLVGVLTGVSQPFGLCTDAGGNVWVVAWGNNTIVEYAHGGTTRLKTLYAPHDDIYDCSVDPTTGNLAVTNWGAKNWFKGNVLIYPHASGKPTPYMADGVWFYYGCAYDQRGNLYVDGWDAYLNAYVALAMLPAGQTKFRDITLHPSLEPPMLGGMQWDGQRVAILNWEWLYIYKIGRTFATGVAVTFLTDKFPIGMFWITTARNGAQTVIAPDSAGDPSAVQFWQYPHAGNPRATITNGLDQAYGVAVSKLPE